MLKMKCPNCDEMIASALLSELEQITCDHCLQSVSVADVLVYAEGFTFHRSDLLKRLFRYKTLLSEVGKEREMLENDVHASEESKKSLERFQQALEEVMAGARNNLRLDFTEPLPVRFSVNEQIHSAALVNLSMTGACLEIAHNVPCPRRKVAIALTISLPGLNTGFDLSGTVSWVDKAGTKAHNGCAVGIEFKSLNAENISHLWDFISSAASAPGQG